MSVTAIVANRIKELCEIKGFTINSISTFSAVPQSTVKSIINGESKNPGIVTIKKLCNGFDISLEEFFATDDFNNLSQEIE